MLGGNISCILRGHRITERIATRIDMGHIIMSEAPDQGPLLNRVSMAQYYVAVVFVLLRLVLYFKACDLVADMHADSSHVV